MFRRRMASIGLVLGCASAMCAQQSPAAPDNDPTQWLNRANLITQAIEDDAARLPADMRAVLPVRLADIWRKVDPQRADAWMSSAVKQLTEAPADETPEERDARIAAADAVVEDVTKDDLALSGKLLDSLTQETLRSRNQAKAQGKRGTQQQMDFSFHLEQAVRQVAQTDPQRALDIAQRALEVGDGNSIVGIYENLRGADPQKADQFAADAMDAARTANYDSFLLFGITQLAATPDPRLPEKMRAPEALRVQVRQLAAEALLRTPITANDKKQICEAVPPVVGILNQYPPDQQAALKTVISSCRAADPQVEKNSELFEAQAAATSKGEGTKPDFSGAKQARERAIAKMNEVRAAEAAKDYGRALDLLDGFTEEERDANPMWAGSRRNLASRWISELYKARDTSGIQRVIGRFEGKERVSQLLSASLIGFRQKDPAYGHSMLWQALNELDKNPDTEDASIYLRLLDAFAANEPEQLGHILPLVIDGINSFKPGQHGRIITPPLGWQLNPILLSPRLVDADPQMLREAIADVKPILSREALRLGLLQRYLERYQQDRNRAPAKSPSASS